MIETIAYVYRWTELSSNRWYIGSRTQLGCHPDDGYICSSKIVKKFILDEPSNWKREILETGTPQQMVVLEHELLGAFNAFDNPKSYNGSNTSMAQTDGTPLILKLIKECLDGVIGYDDVLPRLYVKSIDDVYNPYTKHMYSLIPDILDKPDTYRPIIDGIIETTMFNLVSNYSPFRSNKPGEDSIDKIELCTPFMKALDLFTTGGVKEFNNLLVQEYDKPMEELVMIETISKLHSIVDVSCRMYDIKVAKEMIKRWFDGKSTSIGYLDQMIILAKIKLNSKSRYKDFILDKHNVGSIINQEQCKQLLVDIVQQDVNHIKNLHIDNDVGLTVLKQGLYGRSIEKGIISIDESWVVKYNGETPGKTLNALEVVKLKSKQVMVNGVRERVFTVTEH